VPIALAITQSWIKLKTQMALGLQLSQRLSQSLVLAPQLQQSLALLQAPTLELKALIEQELEQNPVLEEVDAPELELPEKITADVGDTSDATATPDPTERADDAPDAPADAEKNSDAIGDDFQAEFDKLVQMDQEWRDNVAQTNAPIRQSTEDEEKRQFMFDSLTAGTSLAEFLMEQVRESDLNDEQRKTAELIIGNIDDYGYLKATVEEISAANNLSVEKISEVLKTIQTFDPPGVGARDLRECLMLQLERAGKTDSLEYRIVRDFMDALGKRRIPEIARGVSRTVDEVQETLAKIARLEPRPGRAFLPDNDQYILPEVFVQKNGDDFTVTTNDEQIPHLRISNTYKDLMTQNAPAISELENSFNIFGGGSKNSVEQIVAAIKGNDDTRALLELQKLAENTSHLTKEQVTAINHAIAQVREKRKFVEAREYIREKIRAGKFLIKSLHARQQTILNIGKEIVKRQREFMEKGVAHLKPMTMAQIAEVVGVHETTVSRAVSGKYMQTPQGMFEMKFFFTAGLHSNNGGDEVSNASVKDMVVEMFKAEDSATPLSDQQVVKMLGENGITIARRTVAKYRDELGILPSNLRKVY
jgi:RNA polymerase sigma-54 factor